MSTMQTSKNLPVITVSEKQEMRTDILEALNEIDEANDLESLGHRIHFDPREFVSNNPAPTLEEF